MYSSVSKVTAVVLAGGRGTRIAALYPGVPKPLIPASGQPFLYWVTVWLAGQGCRDIVYSTGHMGEKVEAWVASLLPPSDLKLRCRRERQELGTGGGLLNCLDLCADWMLVLNGDSLVVTDIGLLFDITARTKSDGAIVGVPVEDASRFGTLVADHDGILREFAEKRPGKGTINGGIYLFRRSLMEGFPVDTKLSLEHDILPFLIQGGAQLAVQEARNAAFLDIGTTETVDQAGSFIESRSGSFSFLILRK